MFDFNKQNFGHYILYGGQKNSGEIFMDQTL